MKVQLMRLCRLLSAIAVLVFCSNGASAVVVDVDSGAGPGQAYYSNWGPDNADAANPAANSYNNFRKGGVSTPPGLPVVADDGNGTSATWTNATHGGPNPCCGNPGMFFGQSPSTSSYSDAQLFFRSNTEVGNPNNNDPNGRRNFDLRFGFTESPADWQAGKAANSGQWDLWTGDHGSDTIYLQAFVGATQDVPSAPVPQNANQTASSNQFVFINQDLMGQSGNPGTQIGNELDRDRWHKNNLGISTGDMTVVDNSEGQNYTLAAVGSFSATFDTDIPYEGDVPVSWSMEANDPGNADPVLARQVAFKVKFNDVEFTQIFDPGGTDTGTTTDDVVPNPTVDTGNAFEDGFFDWQNAYPVFFVAPNGGATGATMVMGFESSTTPGDGNGDGKVDGDDLLWYQRNDTAGIPTWEANYGTGVTASAAAAGVPEPSSVLLSILTVFCIGGATQRRR